MSASKPPGDSQAATGGIPWWWPHLVVGFFCLAAIVLGALDHFIANDRWGTATDLMLIGSGLTGGGVTIGHLVGWPQSPPS